jgi:hypothetical protein
MGAEWALHGMCELAFMGPKQTAENMWGFVFTPPYFQKTWCLVQNSDTFTFRTLYDLETTSLHNQDIVLNMHLGN